MLSDTGHAQDWEGRRRLSLALAMRAETPNPLELLWRAFGQSVHDVRAVVVPRPYERLIAGILFVLALLFVADLWTSQITARTAPLRDVAGIAMVQPENDGAAASQRGNPPSIRLELVAASK